MAEQRAIIDFRSAGDTGVDDSESVQPVKNIEFADEVVFGRPVENLRRRTEMLRGVVQDLLYYRDYATHIIELTSGGSIAWGGATSLGGTGIVTVTGTLKVSPRAAPAAPVRGSLSVGTASTNQITYAAASAAYATHGLNGITVEHRHATGQALAVTITSGPQRRILVAFDSANLAHTTSAVKNLVDSAIAANADLAGKLTTTLSGAGVIAPIAETALSASADDESHWVSGSLITALTTTRKLSVGDGVAIWYKYTIEPTTDPVDPKGNVAGGRAESSIARGNYNIPAGSLFVTSDEVRKIPGAIVLFRVSLGGQLILLDGTRIAMGETNTLTSVNAQIVAKGYATTSYADNAASTAVSNRATTTYVDSAVSGRTTSTQVDQQITTRLNAYVPPNQGGQTATQVDQSITNRLNTGQYQTLNDVNAKVSGLATTTYVDQQVNSRTTPTAVDQQITTRLNSYVPPSGGITSGQAQALIDSQYSNVVVPAFKTQRSSGAVQLLDVNYTLTSPKFGTSESGILISLLMIGRDGTLHYMNRPYFIADILSYNETITANKWMYLYAVPRNGVSYPVLSNVAPVSEYTGNGYYSGSNFDPGGAYLVGSPLARTNYGSVGMPAVFGEAYSYTQGAIPCFGALRTKGTNTFLTQGCANKVLSFPVDAEPGNRLSSASATTLSFPVDFWPKNAKTVTFGCSSLAGNGGSYVQAYYPSWTGGSSTATSALYLSTASGMGARVQGTAPVVMGLSENWSCNFSANVTLDIIGVTF